MAEVSARPAVPARSAGLIAATVRCDGAPFACATVVAELDAAAIRRLRQEALAMRARYGRPVTIEARFVVSADATRLLSTLADLAAHGIHVEPRTIALAAGSQSDVAAVHGEAEAAQTSAPRAAALSPRRDAAVAVDPFGLDRAFRRAWFTPLRLLFERYWRIQVSGLEHVPDRGGALIAANHSGAIPADAFMLAVALELRQPARCLRVLYDRFVDALPIIGPTYRRLGAVSASFPNAEMLLTRGEVVGLFPEGIAGVEKRCTERYRLRPFKTGAARLSLRTGAPIVPVAIVGAEEAYPVVARLYRAGELVGVPWIPITPTFPLCGLAGAVPLPTKWHMHFGEPILPPARDGRPEEERVADLTAELRAAIATDVAALLAKRRGIFV